MKAGEMRSIRKGMAMTQEGLATALGISRKTINAMENGDEIDDRTALAVSALAHRVRLIEDMFWVEQTKSGSYGVARRTMREFPHAQAMYFTRSELMLYGEFSRREDAYRWSAALLLANNPRNTRKLERQRAAEMARREAREEAFSN